MRISDDKLSWNETTQNILIKTPVFDVLKTHSVSKQDQEGDYIVLETRDWVITVPVIEKDGQKYFVLVRQWRHGAKCLTIEFPGGVLDSNEKPEDGAARELKEETGFVAQKMTHLGSVSPNPAIMRNRVHFFAAENMINVGKQNLDNDEFINCFLEPVEKVFEKMGNEEYSHALMSTALLFYMQNFVKISKF